MARSLCIAPHGREAILRFAQAHNVSANRCPLLRGRLAQESAIAWARTLSEEMLAGTITHIDGKPCLLEIEQDTSSARAQHVQERLL